MVKAIIRIISITTILTATVDAGPWDLVSSFPTPGSSPRGLANIIGLYTVDDSTPPYIYHVYFDGSIMGSFPAPGGPGAWGLAEDYSYLWVSNNLTSWIYKITTAGSLVSSFLCPLAGPADIDMAFDYNPFGGWLIVAVPAQNVIAEINQNTGSLIETFPAPGLHATACGSLVATTGYPFYVTDDYTHKVYKNGAAVITSLQTPVGFAYSADTNGNIRIVWVVDDATDYVYMYYTDEYYTPAAPASLGRIKALFK